MRTQNIQKLIVAIQLILLAVITYIVFAMVKGQISIQFVIVLNVSILSELALNSFGNALHEVEIKNILKSK